MGRHKVYNTDCFIAAKNPSQTSYVTYLYNFMRFEAFDTDVFASC